MIDTIRFQIDISESVYIKIRSKSIELSQRDNELDKELVNILTKKFNVGSYDSHITIRLYNNELAYLEFSVPKMYYGHNVYMIAPEDIFFICDKVRAVLVKMFGEFPECYEWKIKRLDLCYAWKLPSEYIANQVMNIFRGLSVNRKKSHFYDTSVMWYGRTQCFKFYCKYPEFYEHDFKELKKKGFNDLAYQFLNIAEGVVRFEVTLRTTSLTREFYDDKMGSFITLDTDIFNTERITKVLYKYLHKIFKLTETQTMDNKTVYDKLRGEYGTNKARLLYAFYKLMYSTDMNEKLILKSYSRMQTYRYIKRLQDAGIGISSDKVQIGFDFSIPSDYAVNYPHPRD